MKQGGKSSRSVLGSFRDEAVGEAKQVVKDTAADLANQPKKILENILGAPATNEDTGIETPAAGAADPQAKQKAMMQKQIDDKQQSQAKLKRHREQLREEMEHFQAQEQKKEMVKQQEEEQEEEEKKHEIVQMKRQRGEEQKRRQLAGKLGSKEQGRGKKH